MKNQSRKHQKFKKTRKALLKPNQLKSILKYSIIAALWAISIILGVVFYAIQDMPSIQSIVNIEKRPKITIRDANGVIISVYGDIYSDNIPYAKYPQHLIDALLSTEDRRFFEHNGIDIFGITRAAITNLLKLNASQGASTITQQLAKISFLSNAKTWKRKLQEAILAYKIEAAFTKKEILSMYLHRVYMGRGVYGIDAASKFYFGKAVQDISLYEAAMLVGMLKSPIAYNPIFDQIASIQRAKQVLMNMHENNLVTQQDILHAAPPIIMHRGINRGSLKQPYFSDYAFDETYRILEGAKLSADVYTTINLSMHAKIEKAAVETLNNDPNAGRYQIAVIALDRDGKILSMIGGRSYTESQFNRAVYAMRQAGSIFKFFTYVTAFGAGYSPETVMHDAPVTIGKWSPKNINDIYVGDVTLKAAFAKSINSVAVKLSEAVGRKNIIQTAKDMGIKTHIANYPSIALGAVEVSLLDITGAYAHILNDGMSIKPYAISKIIEANSINKLYYHTPVSKQVISSTSASAMRSIMRSVIENGTGIKANINNLKVFGKTGTTQNYRDAWFIGSVPELNITIGVWLGLDDDKSMDKVTGGSLPAEIWRNIVLAIINN